MLRLFAAAWPAVLVGFVLFLVVMRLRAAWEQL